jgi:diacylglycerol kinase family enzyme
LPSATRGTHGSEPEVILTIGSRITIQSESPLPVHTDGDILAFDVRHLEAEILPDAVWVLAPSLAAK